MLIRGVILASVWLLIGIAATVGFATVVVAQVTGTEDVVRSALDHGWESGVLAASILAIVTAVLAGCAYVGVRLFGKHDGIITNESAKVRLRWAEHVSKMEEFHLNQHVLCKIHADALREVVVQCRESRSSQECMCAAVEELVITQLAQHDSEGFIQSTMDDRADFASGMIALADNDGAAVKRAMERVHARKDRATEHRKEVKAKLEKSLEDSGE